jgi:hypothetical protein
MTADDRGAVRDRAAGHIRSGRLAEAQADLAEVLSADPEDRVALMLMGMARFRADDYAGAEQAYRAVVDAAPDDADAHYGLAVSLVRLGRRGEAARSLEAALGVRPGFTQAARRLDELRAAATVAVDDDDVASLAQLLDRSKGVRLDDETLAGQVRWRARPLPIAVVQSAVIAVAALGVPPLLRASTEPLPSGSARDMGAALWRIASAASWPFAVVCVGVGVAAWLTTGYVVREHRLEVTRGVLVRRHVVLWFHDIERQPVVQQNLAEQVLGLASVVVVTDALLLSRTSKRSRLGGLALNGLPAGRAFEFAALLREATLTERRRMIANFISTR